LAREPDDRYQSAREMALALEAVGVAQPSEVAAWVRQEAHVRLDARAALLVRIQQAADDPALLKGILDPTDTAVDMHTATATAVVTDGHHLASWQGRRVWLGGLAFLALIVMIGVAAIVVGRGPGLEAPTGAAANQPVGTNPATLPGAADRTSLGDQSESSGSVDTSSESEPGGKAIAPSELEPAQASDDGEPAMGAPPRAGSRAASSCEVPFTVDENGHRKYKSWCFGDN